MPHYYCEKVSWAHLPNLGRGLKIDGGKVKRYDWGGPALFDEQISTLTMRIVPQPKRKRWHGNLLGFRDIVLQSSDFGPETIPNVMFAQSMFKRFEKVRAQSRQKHDSTQACAEDITSQLPSLGSGQEDITQPPVGRSLTKLEEIRESQRDRTKSKTHSAEVEIARSPEFVWNVITDTARLDYWMRGDGVYSSKRFAPLPRDPKVGDVVLWGVVNTFYAKPSIGYDDVVNRLSFDTCKYVACIGAFESQRELAIEMPTERIAFRLKPHASGTSVTFTLTRFYPVPQSIGDNLSSLGDKAWDAVSDWADRTFDKLDTSKVKPENLVRTYVNSLKWYAEETLPSDHPFEHRDESLPRWDEKPSEARQIPLGTKFGNRIVMLPFPHYFTHPHLKWAANDELMRAYFQSVGFGDWVNRGDPLFSWETGGFDGFPRKRISVLSPVSGLVLEPYPNSFPAKSWGAIFMPEGEAEPDEAKYVFGQFANHCWDNRSQIFWRVKDQREFSDASLRSELDKLLNAEYSFKALSDAWYAGSDGMIYEALHKLRRERHELAEVLKNITAPRSEPRAPTDQASGVRRDLGESTFQTKYAAAQQAAMERLSMRPPFTEQQLCEKRDQLCQGATEHEKRRVWDDFKTLLPLTS